MPISYTIEPAVALVLSRGWGIVTSGELLAQTQALTANPRFDAAWQQLFDLREAMLAQVDTDVVGVLAMLSPFGRGARRAIVAPHDLTYGLARMFELLRASYADAIYVCRSLMEACAWLAVSPETYEAVYHRPPDWTMGL
jgi:hypothetical protein